MYTAVFIFSAYFSRHWTHKCGNIFDFLPKIVSTEIRHCQPDGIFPWSSPQPSGSEFVTPSIFSPKSIVKSYKIMLYDGIMAFFPG